MKFDSSLGVWFPGIEKELDGDREETDAPCWQSRRNYLQRRAPHQDHRHLQPEQLPVYHQLWVVRLPRAASSSGLFRIRRSFSHTFSVLSWQVYKHPGGTDAVGGHPARPSHRFPDARCSDPGQSHPGLCSCSDGHSAWQCPPFNRQHAANGHLRSAVCCGLDLWWILRVSPFWDAASVKPERG